jgi:hypothetical protein
VPIGRDITPLRGTGSLILVNHMYGKTVYLKLGKSRGIYQGKFTIGLTDNPTEATRFTTSKIGRSISLAHRVINRVFVAEHAGE